MHRRIRTLALPTAAAVTLALSACGSSTTGTGSTPSQSHDMGAMSSTASSPSSAPSSSHKDADVTFATDMIPHHAQAVEMADMALKQAKSKAVKALAARIKAAQDPEMTTMSGWLNNWGKPVPQTMAGPDMGSMQGSMGGMMSQAEMEALGKASGTAFDRMWLTMMTKHHQGAVTMAQTELTDGASADAKALARSIITGQTKEISEMRALLAAKP